ncbi:MAG: hypothetical protein RIQ89_1426 [Bacteroidota bacterium]|jgi:uncharacterized iron-regulated protein
MKKVINLLCASSILILVACNKDDAPAPAAAAPNYSDNISNITNNVIIATYADLDAKVSTLVNQLSTLEATPSIANLEASRQAWRDARKPWEQSEGFLFGPVDQQGYDPNMDSWPVNVVDLDAVLNNGNVLTKAYIDALDGTLKGFHTIEYLLWGTDGNKQFNSFTTREFEYLKACAQSLKGVTADLYNAWIPSGGNFSNNLLTAGNGSTLYPSQKSALQEFVNGVITIADEVANGKINDPLSTGDVTLEESRFSANSKADFADNMRSIRNVYIGSLSSLGGKSISSIVSETNASLDAQVKQAIEQSITSIEAIPGTFTTAITANPQAIQAAQTKVRDLQNILQNDLLNFINGL